MTSNAIILRKDFQRIRKQVMARIRRGKIRAETEEDQRTTKVVDALLDDKVDFYTWNENETDDTEKIVLAIVKEWGREGISEDEVVRRFMHVLTEGALRVMLIRGEVITRHDSYGRTYYRNA